MSEDILKIGQFEFRSRLFTGTGKYPNLDTAKKALEASGCEVVTVAVRRVDLKPSGADSIMTVLREGKYTILPNTAGCYTAEDAVRTARLARELLGTPLVKLEVIGDERTLFPDVPATLEAAKTLVDDGFTVLPYINDDPIAALRLWKTRLRRGHAAGRADRQRARRPQSVQHRDHRRARDGAGDRRRGRRHRVRCGDRHGARRATAF